MRIKKKELLEALDPNKTIDNLNKGRDVINAAKDFEDYAKTVVKPEVADELTNAIVEPKEQNLEEESADKVHTKKFDSCVKKVKANSHVDNPYAVCQDSLGKDAIRKAHQRTVKEVIKVKNLKK
jgi:hypothetical protein